MPTIKATTSRLTLLIGILFVCAVAAATESAPDRYDSGVESPGVEEIVVTASSTPIELHKVGSSVSVLTADDLKLSGVRYAADALRQVPGVSVSRSGNSGGFTQVRVRGAEANHVLVLVDGVEIAPSDSGEVDLSTVLASDISRIEVIRGPQSGLFGSNALAGVVAIYTHPFVRGPTLRFEAETGSFESSLLHFSAALGNQDTNAVFNLTRRNSTGLNNAPRGTEEDDTAILSFSGRASARVSPELVLDASLRYVDKDSESDELDFSGGPRQGEIIDAPGDSDTVDQHIDVGARWDKQNGRWSGRFNFSRSETELAGRGSFGPFGSDTTRSQLSVHATLNVAGDQVAQNLTGFMETERETFRNTFPTDPSQAPKFARDLTGFGMEYRADLSNQLFLSAAVRRDRNNAFDDATTYRFTASRLVREGQGRAHFSFGKGVTNPTFFEQYGFTPGFFVGNPDLRPEQSIGWDLGMEWRFGDERVIADVTWFEADLQDEILPLFPSVVNAVGSSDRQGVELGLRARLTSHLDLSAAYTHTRSEDSAGITEIRRPKHIASADLAYRFGQNRGRLYLGIVHNGSMLDTDFRSFFSNGFVADTTLLRQFTLFNIGAAYQLNPQVEIFGRIDNVLDENYQEVLGYRSPGRGAYGGVRVQFSR